MDFELAETYYTRGLVKEYIKDYPQAAVDYAHAVAIDEKYSKAFEQLEVCVRKAMDVRERLAPADSDKVVAWQGDRELTTFKPYKEKVSDLTFNDYGGDSKQKALFKQIYRIQIDLIRRRASEPMIADKIDYKRIAAMSEGFVGAEIKEIVERAVNRQVLHEIDSKEVYEVSTENLIEVIENYKKDRDLGKERRPIGFIGIEG